MIPQLSELERRLCSNQGMELEEASLFVRELAKELADLVRLTGFGCAAILEKVLNRHAEPPPPAVATRSNLAVPPARSLKVALTVKEVAAMFGVAEPTVRLWIGRRTVAVIRLGRSVRIPRPEVERLISENTIPALKRR